MEKAINDATLTKAGDTFQHLIALKDCFEMDSGETLQIEVNGDVSVINSKGGRFQKEVKHHFDDKTLSDRNIDFWKTLANWYEDYDRIKGFSCLILYTTASVVKTSFDNWNEKTKEEKLVIILEIGKETKNAEKKKILTETLQPQIKRAVDNEALFFDDIIPKSLLYDAQQYIEQFWNAFKKSYNEILDRLTTNIYFSEENILLKIYMGNMPTEINQFLIKQESAIDDTYRNMADYLRKCIKDFFEKRICELKKLLPQYFDEKSENTLFNEEIKFNSSNISFLNCLREILTAEQLKILVRHNSKILSLKNFPPKTDNLDKHDIIFLESNFRKELWQLLEIEFTRKADSVKAHLIWEIFSAIKKTWSKISDTVHSQIEDSKEKFSSSLKEIDNQNEQLIAETNQYLDFLKNAQLAMKNFRN